MSAITEAISAAIQTKTADFSQVLQYFGISLDNLCGPIGMSADSPVAAAVYLEALSKAKGTNGKR